MRVAFHASHPFCRPGVDLDFALTRIEVLDAHHGETCDPNLLKMCPCHVVDAMRFSLINKPSHRLVVSCSKQR